MTEFEHVAAFAYETGRLKRLHRSGWDVAGVPDPETVAEHSFRVALIAFVLAALEGGNPERAAVLGLFHDLPETRLGDVPAVGKAYVTTVPAVEVVNDQVAKLPPDIAARIKSCVVEHEGAKGPAATLEARCSRDADRLECLLQAREYELAGHTDMGRFFDSMLRLIATDSGKQMAAAAMEVSPSAWWSDFGDRFGTDRAAQRPDS